MNTKRTVPSAAEHSRHSHADSTQVNVIVVFDCRADQLGLVVCGVDDVALMHSNSQKSPLSPTA